MSDHARPRLRPPGLRRLGTLLGVLVPLTMAASSSAQVAVLTTSPADEPVVVSVSTVVDEPILRRDSAHVRDPLALLAHARAHWDDSIVLVVDVERSLITAIRPDDGTIVERRLDPRAARAPYVVAQAVAELVVVVREAPPAQAAALPSRSPHAQRRVSVAPEVGWALASSFDDPLFFSGPTIGVSMNVSSRGGRLGTLSIRATPHLRLSRRRGAIEAEYRRSDITLEGALGHQRGQASVALGAQLGMVIIRVRARQGVGAGLERDGHERIAPWLGIGGNVSYGFDVGAFFRLGLSLGMLPGARLIRVGGIPIFDEGVLQLRSQILVGWNLP